MKQGSGYVLVKAPEGYPGHKYRGKYLLESHAVWWQRTGTLVPKGFVLHHENEIKDDNRIENLVLKELWRHTAEHRAKTPTPAMSLDCCCCKKEFKYRMYKYRWAIKQGQIRFFCSRKCQRKTTAAEMKLGRPDSNRK